MRQYAIERDEHGQQLSLLREPETAPASRDVPVWLVCPACGYEWLSAILRTGAWWAAGQTPEKVAKAVYCPYCSQRPPMLVATTEHLASRSKVMDQ